jgi:hypothetical protein
VGSSFAPLLLLLDVRLAKADVLESFPPVLEGLRDGLPPPSPVLDELREEREESSQRREGFPEEREESSERLEKSSQRLKESPQRRFELKSARSRLRASTERLFQRRQEGRAHVEERLAPRFRLEQPLSRARGDGFGPKEPLKGLLERRSGARSVVSKSREAGDCLLEPL